MYIKFLVAGVLLLFLQHAARIIYLLGFHLTVFNHTPGLCYSIPGVGQGAEDIETLSNGLTFISSGHALPGISSEHFINLYITQGKKGKILLFDFRNPNNGVTELTLDPAFQQKDFHPHGLSVLENNVTGTVTLFVVNHREGRDTIEKFEFVQDEMMLKHTRTYSDKSIFIVNDVAAKDEDSFYFTNSAYSRTHTGFLLEILLLLPWGNVMFYNGANYEVVSDNRVSPNGVLFSEDKRSLYVANFLGLSMSVFHVEEDDKLTVVQEYQLNTIPDNFALDRKTGNLLVGAHPIMHMLTKHLDMPDKAIAPSRVIVVHMKNNSYANGITELYSDDGNNLSGSSVASLYDNKMLIGSVYDRLVYCDVRTLE